MTPMRRSQNWLPYVFNDLFDNDWMIKANSTAPAINVIESEKDYRVEVAAPGMTKDDFNIRIDENDNLVVSMEKKEEKNEEDSNKKESYRAVRNDEQCSAPCRRPAVCGFQALEDDFGAGPAGIHLRIRAQRCLLSAGQLHQL